MLTYFAIFDYYYKVIIVIIIFPDFGINSGQQVDDSCTFMYNSSIKRNGFFTSPNYPGLYPKDLSCHYYFFGETNEWILIRFEFFDVEGISR